jgi:hypothetical protein
MILFVAVAYLYFKQKYVHVDAFGGENSHQRILHASSS